MSEAHPVPDALKERWPGYAWAAAATLACTLAGLAIRGRFDLVNVAMIYLLGIATVALRYTRGPTVFATVLSTTVAAINSQ